MVVQCQACKTRFRLADEKVKPGGTKVRCSKCKEVFKVMPPEPAPVEEAVDFNALNMEQVPDDAPVDESTAEESQAEAAGPQAEATAPPEFEDETAAAAVDESSDELDFGGLETEMTKAAGTTDEFATETSFADTGQPVDAEEAAAGIATDDEPSAETIAQADETDFGAAFEEAEEQPAGPTEFDFSNITSAEQDDETAEEETLGTAEFKLEDEQAEVPEQEEAGEFDFGDEEDASAVSFDDDKSKAPIREDDGEFDFGDEEDFSFDEQTTESGEAENEPGEFSFDEEESFGEGSTSEWEDESDGDVTSFDFEEPQFDTEPAQQESAADGEEGGLQFGEIDLTGDEGEGSAPAVETDNEFAGASLESKEEPDTFVRREPSPPPRARDDDDVVPLPAPPKKKSSLSRILVLLVLLLAIIGGAAGFLFMQNGALNLNTVAEYLPFLKDYISKPSESETGDRIGINVSGSSYVNGKAGQMLVIQGSAVNNHTSSRSSIMIKGILLDAQGKALLQQTVFCGNPFDAKALAEMPFSAIEREMNNEFGDSLSNMNVGQGVSIPFTIVFRNVPDGIANINVEVVGSKPGAG